MHCFIQSEEPDLRAWPAVSVAGPQQSDQVEAEESAEQCQHHVVLRHSGKQLCCARYVHIVRHHKEGAPEQSEVVTQTLRPLRSAFLSHLRQKGTHHHSNCNLQVLAEHHWTRRSKGSRVYRTSSQQKKRRETHLAAIGAPSIHVYLPIQALGHERTDPQCQAWHPSGVGAGFNIPDSRSLLQHLRGYHPAIASCCKKKKQPTHHLHTP